MCELYLRGYDAQGAGDIATALDLHARVLAVPGAEQHPDITEVVLHCFGVCSTLMGDRSSAWPAFIASARLAQERHEKVRGAKGTLSDPLDQAGLLLVDFSPAAPIREDVPHALLLGGMVDALDHAVERLLGVGLPDMDTARAVHRKLTGLMLLAVGAAADVILENAALALYHRVALPFSERPDVRHRVEIEGPRFVAAALDALARLFDALAEQERPRRVGVPPTSEEVKRILDLATVTFAGVIKRGTLTPV